MFYYHSNSTECLNLLQHSGRECLELHPVTDQNRHIFHAKVSLKTHLTLLSLNLHWCKNYLQIRSVSVRWRQPRSAAAAAACRQRNIKTGRLRSCKPDELLMINMHLKLIVSSGAPSCLLRRHSASERACVFRRHKSHICLFFFLKGERTQELDDHVTNHKCHTGTFCSPG